MLKVLFSCLNVSEQGVSCCWVYKIINSVLYLLINIKYDFCVYIQTFSPCDQLMAVGVSLVLGVSSQSVPEHVEGEQKRGTDTENATIPNRKMAGASVREVPSTQKQLPATQIRVKVCIF